MIYLHKILPLLLSPVFLVLLLVVAGSLTGSRWMGLSAALLLYLASTPYFSDHLFRYVEAYQVKAEATSQPECDAIVVLGGMLAEVASTTGVTTEWQDPDRFLAGLALFKAKRAPVLVFTRGLLPWSVSGQPEGDMLRDYAIELGVPESAIRLTDVAQNTAQEAEATKRLLNVPNPSVLLVTSAFHMPRAQRLFERQGMHVVPYPVDFKVMARQNTPMDFLPSAESLAASDLAIRELVGRLYYRWT
jgi:uncharacterized SAM-binding protein YcdF (DUF218 family)